MHSLGILGDDNCVSQKSEAQLISRCSSQFKKAFSPNFDVFPVGRRVADVVGKAVQAFEEAGAHVEEARVGIGRNQRELSDVWCRLITYFVNFSGHPAASIPAGLVEGKLPVGMQIIGRRYADADVLAASATFERLRPWHESYKLCFVQPLKMYWRNPYGSSRR
jgi:Asp-tRNA(Asn)/Glu-tRNA(Gln) amidotransferase A subunit family amidase